MLVAVVVMVALVLIALSVAAPVVAKSIRRDKEIESEHRAEQYVRAIRLYYRKTHAYPPSIDALKQSNNIRFLRQEYTDPLTGKADWRIIHQGEQKTTIKGFFGEPLGGLGSSGTGGGGLGSASGMGSGFGSPIGGRSGSMGTIGSTSPLASGFSGAGVGTDGGGGAGGTSGMTGTTGSSGSTGSGFAGNGLTGSGSMGGSGSTGGALGSLSGSASGGVGPIVGIGPAATGNSITDPNQQETYEAWEFWYDPRIEQLYQKGRQNAGAGTGALGSQPASSFGSPANGQPNSGTGPSTSNIFGAGGSGAAPNAGTNFGNTTPSSPQPQ